MPFHPLTFDETVGRVASLIEAGTPSYFVTANLNYVMLCHLHGYLREINERAAFVAADGVTLVLASRYKRTPLPERVTGADLMYGLSQMAAARGFRLFLLGGLEGVGGQAARNLAARYPGLQVAGIESPPYREMTPGEEAALIGRIRDARPDILFTAFNQPRGERWLAANVHRLGVPACANVGAAFDFTAGRVKRAPRWAQRLAMETPYRILQEPRRLLPRYLGNARFLVARLLEDARAGLTRRPFGIDAGEDRLL